jgi:hypothetical protein
MAARLLEGGRGIHHNSMTNRCQADRDTPNPVIKTKASALRETNARIRKQADRSARKIVALAVAKERDT